MWVVKWVSSEIKKSYGFLTWKQCYHTFNNVNCTNRYENVDSEFPYSWWNPSSGILIKLMKAFLAHELNSISEELNIIINYT